MILACKVSVSIARRPNGMLVCTVLALPDNTSRSVFVCTVLALPDDKRRYPEDLRIGAVTESQMYVVPN